MGFALHKPTLCETHFTEASMADEVGLCVLWSFEGSKLQVNLNMSSGLLCRNSDKSETANRADISPGSGQPF